MNQINENKTEEYPVRIEVPSASLEGSLCLPHDIKGIVLFAHGSGSSRNSPRNRYVARVLQSGGMGTLLFDLLTPEEEAEDEQTGKLRLNIKFLAKRLAEVTDSLPGYLEWKISGWVISAPAQALLRPWSRRRTARYGKGDSFAGGRPDMAEQVLARVKAPHLLIVGGQDFRLLS
jgi:hypothetical protein